MIEKLDEWLETAKKCQALPEGVMKTLCDHVKDILVEESNIQPVYSPVTVCGDIHGQFYDLMELFRVGGELPDTKYIFMVSAPQLAYLRATLLTEATFPSKHSPSCSY